MARTQVPYTFNVSAGAGSKTYFKALSDSLTGCGLTRTADTGQIDWTTSTDGQGYEVLAWADASQATAPLFCRVRYVAGSEAGGGGVYITTGTATNGAGTITGTFTPELRLTNYSSVGAVTARTAYASHGEGYLTWMFDVDAALASGTDGPGSVVIERFRNADGSSAGDGFNAWWMMRSNTNITGYQGSYSRTTGAASQPAVEIDHRIVAPNLVNTNTYIIGNTTYAFPALTAGIGLRGASKALLAGFHADFPRNSEISIAMYGGNLTFRSYSGLLNLYIPYWSPTGVQSTKTFCPILRWE